MSDDEDGSHAKRPRLAEPGEGGGGSDVVRLPQLPPSAIVPYDDVSVVGNPKDDSEVTTSVRDEGLSQGQAQVEGRSPPRPPTTLPTTTLPTTTTTTTTTTTQATPMTESAGGGGDHGDDDGGEPVPEALLLSRVFTADTPAAAKAKPSLSAYVASLNLPLDSPPSSSTNTKKRKRVQGGDTVEEQTRAAVQETSFVFSEGLRRVLPYYYTFEANVKGRWIGRTVFDVFTSEFKANTDDYYRRAIADGRIRIEGQLISESTRLPANGRVTHVLHRHEPPVVGAPLPILDLSDHVVVVSKPPSIPVHSCGRYRHNSVQMILAHEAGIFDMHNVHRLDRLTSGLLIGARSRAAATHLGDLISTRRVQKTYLARVRGAFPLGQVIVCDAPILVIGAYAGKNTVSADGKPSRTTFLGLSFNGRTSLVKCWPHTGRTHQIRVHLLHLGFPIANDPVHNGSEWKRARSFADDDDEDLEGVDGGSSPFVPSFPPEFHDPVCPHCAMGGLPDPRPCAMELWLHALEYEGEEWYASAPPPHWAVADFEGDKYLFAAGGGEEACGEGGVGPASEAGKGKGESDYSP